MSKGAEHGQAPPSQKAKQAHVSNSPDAWSTTTESQDLPSTFDLHFDIDRTNLNEAWRKVHLPRTSGIVDVELGAEQLGLRTTNDNMQCNAAVALNKPSGLPQSVVVRLRTTADLFEKVLCSQVVHTIVQRGKNPAAELLSFSSSGQLTAPEYAETSETPCWFEIVDANLRIRWPFQCTAIELREPVAKPQTAAMQSSAALRECLNLLTGFAREHTGHPSFQGIEVANQFARAGTNDAIRTVSNSGLGALKLNLHVKDASPLSSILSAYSEMSFSVTEQDQVCASPSGTCSVKRPPLQPPSFEAALKARNERTAWIAAHELAASIDRIIAQVDSAQRAVDVELTPGAMPWLSFSTPIEGGEAVVRCRAKADEDGGLEPMENPYAGSVSIDALKRIVAYRSGQSAQLKFHPTSIELVEQNDGIEVRTFINCTRPTMSPELS